MCTADPARARSRTKPCRGCLPVPSTGSAAICPLSRSRTGHRLLADRPAASVRFLRLVLLAFIAPHVDLVHHDRPGEESAGAGKAGPRAMAVMLGGLLGDAELAVLLRRRLALVDLEFIIADSAGAVCLVFGACPSARAFAARFVQTPPHDDALALHLTFFTASGCPRDFHSQDVEHARHPVPERNAPLA